MSEEYLYLKWGTLKAWDLGENEAALAAARRYDEDGSSWSAMAQRDTANQKQAICDIIDALNGPITNDWTGEEMSKEEAKRYVMEYRR